jgi:hypothetical protein
MTMAALLLVAMLTASLAIDKRIQPRGLRSLAGSIIHILAMLLGFGVFLAFSGHLPGSALLVVGLMMAVALGSNVKHKVLGEPLLFSDLALVGAIVRHPQFYFSALRPWQIVLLGTGAAVLPALLAWVFVARVGWHLAGLMTAAAALALLALLPRLPPWRNLPLVPDTVTDVERHGLLATMLLHAKKWRDTSDPPAPGAADAITSDAELLIIIQCESFADPVELFGNPALALPGLSAARAKALHHGKLLVSGFGAYTMRTEYGVLFGRSEAQLGFRRFDPFLTALGEAGHALPARLRSAGWRSIFVHPHDLGFYGRDRIMPAAGFDELLGEADFPPPGPGEGRYVTDAALGSRIVELANAACCPTLIYAVSIENHGPWPADQASGGGRQSGAYLRLARKGDAMLSRLVTTLGARGRPALLVFFGDHRPSIPGLSDPGGDRHTPYVVLRFGTTGRLEPGDAAPRALSPAELHAVIVQTLAGPAAVTSAPSTVR